MVDHQPVMGLGVGLRHDLDAWPAPVRVELERRAMQVRARAQGRVLDLDHPPARELVRRLGAIDQDPAFDGDTEALGAYDAVVSVAALVEFADLPLAIRGIDRVLHPAGALFFIEPVARPGWTGLASATLGSLLGAVRDQHLGRDVPLAIRASPFIITDIERFTMPSPLWPLRPFVHGRAMRFDGVTS